uniref:DALR anticodon binding domain-containing protein n=1 Tax=Timema poppense TaxID=170557 RepID=A0A7R9DIE7_TIMPO|nr:unnamed protein product [Timema poppensis]
MGQHSPNPLDELQHKSTCSDALHNRLSGTFDRLAARGSIHARLEIKNEVPHGHTSGSSGVMIVSNILLVARTSFSCRVNFLTDFPVKLLIILTRGLQKERFGFIMHAADCRAPDCMPFGAAFVLYNCARLAAICKQFDDKVAEGHYPHLIPLQDVDFSLLKHELRVAPSRGWKLIGLRCSRPRGDCSGSAGTRGFPPSLRNVPHPIILADFLLVVAPGQLLKVLTQRAAKSLPRLSYEEWTLLCKHLLFYPNILENSVREVESGIIEPQLLSRFLMSLCANFSIYYRRVRILTEPRNHLLPVMFARLYLLKGIEQVLHNALRIMDITPLTQM